jgi:hypothetical protein
MRWSLACILPFGFLAVGCATTSPEHTALLERRDAIRAMDAARQEGHFNEYRGTEGFQQTRWGMTPEEVLALYPEAVRTPHGDLSSTVQVADRIAATRFTFAQGRLAAVTLAFVLSGDLRSEYGSLSELLTMKYGKPLATKDTARDAAGWLAFHESMNFLSHSSGSYQAAKSGVAYKPDPVGTHLAEQREERARLEVLRSELDYALVSDWKNAETKLSLSGRQSPGRQGLILHYASTYFAPTLRQVLTEREQQRQQERAREL